MREGGYYRCKVRITLDNSHFTGSLSLNRKTGNFTTQPKSLSLCLSLAFLVFYMYIYTIFFLRIIQPLFLNGRESVAFSYRLVKPICVDLFVPNE